MGTFGYVDLQKTTALTHLAYLGQGRDYHVHKWLPALAEQGLQVSLISYIPPDVELPGVEVRLLTPPVAASWKELSIRDFWGSVAPLKALLGEIGADVLMASFATHYGWLGTRTRFHPVIAQTWTADISIYPWSGWKQWLFRPMVRRVLRDADVITTDGDALAQVLKRRFPSLETPVIPVRWGIRLADYEFSDDRRAAFRREYGIPSDSTVVTSARGVLHIFRPRQVLESLLNLLEQREDVHVVFLTLARDRSSEVQSLLDALAAHPRGHVFDRFLSTREMADVWSASDAVISVPSHDGVSEGLLEAMYAGSIPIVSDIPSNRSFLEDGISGVFVKGDPGSVSDISSTLAEVVEGIGTLRDRIVSRNRAWIVAEASVEASAKKVADLVRELATSD